MPLLFFSIDSHVFFIVKFICFDEWTPWHWYIFKLETIVMRGQVIWQTEITSNPVMTLFSVHIFTCMYSHICFILQCICFKCEVYDQVYVHMKRHPDMFTYSKWKRFWWVLHGTSRKTNTVLCYFDVFGVLFVMWQYFILLYVGVHISFWICVQFRVVPSRISNLESKRGQYQDYGFVRAKR